MAIGACDEQERLLRLGLWLLSGISSRTIDRLIDHFGSARAAVAAPREALLALLELPPAVSARLASADVERLAREEAACLHARAARFVLRGDAGYPSLAPLRDPPEALAVRGGSLTARLQAHRGAVAIVGSRAPDDAGRRQARQLGRVLAEDGFVIVSGGAIGIDAAAHEGALEAGGCTIAVLGSGVLVPSPARNRALFARLLQQGGLLVSELPAREPPRAQHFPRRNRLIAALAAHVVVLRAGEKSGSLHTAAYARTLSRVLYVPRGGGGAGVEALRTQGARLFSSCDELRRVLGGRPTAPARTEDLRGRILEQLHAAPTSIAALASTLGEPAPKIAAELAQLCLTAEARPCGPGLFAPKARALDAKDAR